jgi:hypothetical protein
MRTVEYRGRRAASIENDQLRLTATVEGGHIAEILHKASGTNPLWTPPWPSIEPSTYRREQHPEYGADAESKLLAGIMGHNLCLDVFGPVSPEEEAAGMTVHGEASVNAYEFSGSGEALLMRTTLEAAQLGFERQVTLDGAVVRFTETVENLGATDRPIAWTQHVTLGPPFVTRGVTRFEVNAGRSRSAESGGDGYYIEPAIEFEWPNAPAKGGGTVDMRTFSSAERSAGFTTHLMSDPAHFTAEANGVRFGYRWRREDFPWLGIWEENHSRTQAPWNGKTITRGMEFGVSPYPETRRAMIERKELFGVPAYRWIPARTRITVRYEAFFETVD